MEGEEGDGEVGERCRGVGGDGEVGERVQRGGRGGG